VTVQALTTVARGAWIDHFLVTAVASVGRHTTVLQARQGDSYVALKLATTPVGNQLVEHEQRVLPARFVGAGDVGEDRYCASAWVHGVDARIAAAECRRDRLRADLAVLCGRVARAYAAVHAHGVVHGQVHPRHLLVDGDGSVQLVDFSVSASPVVAPPPARLEARLTTMAAPEQAEALLRGDEIALTTVAEQYSVAALLYLLVTARRHVDVRLDRALLAHDIAVAPLLAFADRGVEPWPEVEAVLGRALAKDPAARYESVAALAEALEAVPPEAAPGRRRPTRELEDVLETFRHEAASPEATAGLKPPTCSINFGAAGIAFALTRIGIVADDPTAFADAERWLAFAEQNAASSDAFDDGDELTSETVGVVSPFHSASGIAAAQAFLGAATGDHARQQAALDDYRALTAPPCTNLDLTLGRSAVLLVAALLYASADPWWPAAGRLARYGDELCAGIWAEAGVSSVPYYNGIAHGWAGLAYATLMWSSARGVDAPGEVRRVLDELAAAAEPHGRGARWPLTPPSGSANDEFWPGWCHGNAGYVFLWNVAEQAYPGSGFGTVGVRAASLLEPSTGVTSLCCGSAGQAYAALNEYRATGDERWLRLAQRLAERGATSEAVAGDAPTPLSLYKGQVGLALLALELARPELAMMPLFEFEPALGHKT
jgi:eukaryotic-like serine/threonine-protein kinase